MTEVRQAREVDLVPQELRFVPQVKSDIIIQRRNVSLAPIEAANTYTRNGTNTITFNVQGHKELSQLLDAKSVYFQMQCRFNNAYPSEDVSMLFEEVIISSNGRTIERIRDAQYIQKFLRGYGMSRDAKARLGKREGFQQYEDCTVQMTSNAIAPPDPVGNGDVADAAGIVAAVNALRAPTQHGYGYKKAATTATAPVVGAAAGGAAAHAAGDDGFTDIVGDTAWPTANITRMSANLGYLQKQVNRTASGTNPAGAVWGGGGQITGMAPDGWHLMKFRLPCSGLLNSEKMLPIMSMPLTIQLRLSDPSRCCDKQQGADNFDYEIRRPRMRMQVCSVGQAYASAMVQRLRGPGITLNCKMFDTYFQIINEDRQIVIPSNKQRLSKVYVMLHNEASTTARDQDAFRSSVSGLPQHQGMTAVNGALALRSYQFQIGTEVSEAVTLEESTGNLVPDRAAVNAGAGHAFNVNTGMAFFEAYLRSIGAVNGHEQDVEYWGRNMYPDLCNAWEGGDLLQTFLSKYFCCVYDGEKLLGSQIETGVDTESGKDIVVDLRFAAGGRTVAQRMRCMVLVQYHAQIIIKENSVDLSY